MSLLEEYERQASLPADRAECLPFGVFRDPAVYEREIADVFQREWIVGCAELSLAAPGACYAFDIAGEPVALVRGRDGRLRALSNVCRHRGTPLLPPGFGTLKSNITCPYHAWAYDDTGHFLGAPHAGSTEIDAEAHRLPEFRVESWGGIAFVCLDAQTEALAERLAGIDGHLAGTDPSRFPHAEAPQEPELWEANWKLAFQNSIESYHLFKVHRETLEQVTPTKDAYYVAGSAPWSVTGGRTLGEGDYRLISLPPSFVGILYEHSLAWSALRPQGPASTRVESGAISIGAQSDAERRETDAFTKAFFAEDKRICELAQRGIQSRRSAGGRLVDLERVVADFHRYLAWRLFGTEPEPVFVERR